MKKLLGLCAVIVFILTAAAARANLVVPDGTLDVGGQEIAIHREGTTATLSNPEDYSWWYGCSPTAAGMLMGYYDVRGYDNLVQGGAAENSTYGGDSYLANNAIASSGHISDFYTGSTNTSGDDAATPGHNFDCLADFMGTSQDAYGNSNGWTTFLFRSNNSPLTESYLYNNYPKYYNKDGMYGIGEYINYAGYDAAVLYSQYIYGYGEKTAGFTYEQYKAEIDAGRPVLIHVTNHTIFGYGYDSATNSIILHDTWTQGEHSMVWGGSYEGLNQYGVTVLTIIPEPATVCLLGIGVLSLIRHRKQKTKKDEYYSKKGRKQMKTLFLICILLFGLAVMPALAVPIIQFSPGDGGAGNWSYDGAGTITFNQDIVVDSGLGSGDTLVGAWVNIPDLFVSGIPGGPYTLMPDTNNTISITSPGGAVTYLSGTLGEADLFPTGTTALGYYDFQIDITNVIINNTIGSNALAVIAAMTNPALDFALSFNGAPANGFKWMLDNNKTCTDGFSGAMDTIPEPATVCLLGIGALSLLNRKFYTQKKKREVMKTNVQFIIAILVAIICLAAAANATVIQPSPKDVYDLVHENFYIWQVNLSIPEDQILTSVSIFFDNINDWQIESGDKMFISLLNENKLNNAVQDKHMTKAIGSNIYRGTDNGAIGNALDGYSQILTVYEDNNEYWKYYRWINPAEDFTYNFSISEISLLNGYISSDGVFGIGFDPDCHYYNDGVTLSYETTTIPEPATICLLAIGSLALIGRKK